MPTSEAQSQPIGAWREIAREIRRLIVESVFTARAGHLGGPLSATDILVALASV